MSKSLRLHECDLEIRLATTFQSSLKLFVHCMVKLSVSKYLCDIYKQANSSDKIDNIEKAIFI